MDISWQNWIHSFEQQVVQLDEQCFFEEIDCLWIITKCINFLETLELYAMYFYFISILRMISRSNLRLIGRKNLCPSTTSENKPPRSKTVAVIQNTILILEQFSYSKCKIYSILYHARRNFIHIWICIIQYYNNTYLYCLNYDQ